MKKLLILSILLIVGCDNAPSEHTHDEGGICVNNYSHSNDDHATCFGIPSQNISNFVPDEVSELYCEEKSSEMTPLTWYSSYSSCSEYCEEWCARKGYSMVDFNLFYYACGDSTTGYVEDGYFHFTEFCKADHPINY